LEDGVQVSVVEDEFLKRKIPLKIQEDYYMDGLVSTGNKFPYTILKRIFPFQKIFFIYFINIHFSVCGKGQQLPIDPATFFQPTFV